MGGYILFDLVCLLMSSQSAWQHIFISESITGTIVPLFFLRELTYTTADQLSSTLKYSGTESLSLGQCFHII